MKDHGRCARIGAAFMVLWLVSGALPAAAADLVVADGLTVWIEYTLTLPDKTVIASNVGKDPAWYVQGQHQIAPGLEKALVGMKAGEQKHVVVAAVDGYGPYDEKARITVDKSQVPDEVKVGSILSSPDGAPVKVVEVKDDKVVLDTNHPLAGKDLIFDVKVVKIDKEQPTPAAEPGAQPDEAEHAPAEPAEGKP